MNHGEYKPGNIAAVEWFNESGGEDISTEGKTVKHKSGARSQETSVGGSDAAACWAPTDLYVCLLVGRHLPEAERRDVAPHAEGLGNASPCVAGVYQVCGEGEQPARRQQQRVVNTLCVHTFLWPCQKHKGYCSDQKSHKRYKYSSITGTCSSLIYLDCSRHLTLYHLSLLLCQVMRFDLYSSTSLQHWQEELEPILVSELEFVPFELLRREGVALVPGEVKHLRLRLFADPNEQHSGVSFFLGQRKTFN